MKGFLFLSGVVFSAGLFIPFSLSLLLLGLVLLLDHPKACGDHLCVSPIFSFRCLPASLIEFTDDHQVLTTMEKVNFEFSQFPKGHDVDSIPASPAH
jgi:hypothetical protein